MTSSPPKGTWQREELLHLLSLSGTLAGLCITGVTLFHTLGRSSLPETIADDSLAISERIIGDRFVFQGSAE